MELTIQIIGEDLTSIDFGERNAGTGRSRLFLGIQRGQEVVDAVPVTAERAVFAAQFSVAPLPGGETNFLGPYAHGTRLARFCYLSWLTEGEDGNKRMFARVKLALNTLWWERVEVAARSGTPFVMRVSLRAKNGGPVYASVPNDAIRWDG